MCPQVLVNRETRACLHSHWPGNLATNAGARPTGLFVLQVMSRIFALALTVFYGFERVNCNTLKVLLAQR